MVGEALAGLSAFKTALDLAKGLKDIDDRARRNAAVIELQEKILAAQMAQSALIERVSELEKEVANLKAWDADKKRYKLTEVRPEETPGLFAYALKEGMENGEPTHYLCANCYSHNEKSFLQTELRFPGHCDVLTCHRCGSDLYVTGSPDPDHARAKRRR